MSQPWVKSLKYWPKQEDYFSYTGQKGRIGFLMHIFLFATVLETECNHHGSPLSLWVLPEVHAERVPRAGRLPGRLGVDCASHVRQHNPRVPPRDVELCPHSLLLLPGTHHQKEKPTLADNFSSADAIQDLRDSGCQALVHESALDRFRSSRQELFYVGGAVSSVEFSGFK